MLSRLIFFEGPPGAGKSSLSQFVTRQIVAAGMRVEWIEEHPLNDTVFADFLGALDAGASVSIPILMGCWQRLLDSLNATDSIYCLDGAFFHSTLKLLLAWQVDAGQVNAYLEQLYALLTPLQPPLIHLTGDVPQIMRSVIAERGQDWAEHIARDIAEYPCQRARGLTGLDGMLDFFVNGQRQTETIAAQYPFARRQIDTTGRAWEQYQQDICGWLGIPVRAEDRLLPGDLAQYTGAYHTPDYFPPEFNHPFYVEEGPDGLRLHMVFMRNFRLVYQGADNFAILGRPLTAEFIRDDQANITGVIYPFVPGQRFFCPKSVENIPTQGQ